MTTKGSRPNWSKRPTRLVAKVPHMSLYERAWKFFDKFGPGPFELEAIVHFIVRGLDVTPYQYTEVARTVRDYIMENYRIEQGEFRPRTDMFIRVIKVYER